MSITNENIFKLIESYSKEKVVEIIPILKRGDVNQVFKIKTQSKIFILRSDSDEFNIDRFRKEAWCAREALKLGILTPEVYELGLEAGHPYMIMSFIDGINGDEANEECKKVIWKKLGEYAKKIQSISVKGYGDKMSAPGVFSDSWMRYLEYNISSLHSNDKILALGVISGRESQQIRETFLDLKNAKLNFGLIHYDISLSNTIITKNGEVYLIDWGAAEVAVIPHLEIAEILDESLKENSLEFKLFLEGFGLEHLEYEKLKPEINQIHLLVYMDKLRWAMDRHKESIGHFSQEVKNKLVKIQ